MLSRACTTLKKKKKTMKIIDNNGKETSGASVLKAYFGMKPDQKLQDFMTEIKALAPEDKDELVVGAAKELGWTVS